MKIAVKVTIEVTPEQAEDLSLEYGLEGAEDIREFAKSYIANQAQESTAGQFWTATAR